MHLNAPTRVSKTGKIPATERFTVFTFYCGKVIDTCAQKRLVAIAVIRNTTVKFDTDTFRHWIEVSSGLHSPDLQRE